MKHLIFKTYIKANPDVVWKKFDKNLFTKLNPPFPRVVVLRFDGCQVGDIVALNLDFLIFQQTWISKIIENNTTAQGYYFIDEGISLPFMLSAWKHIHRIESFQSGTLIIDEIFFETPWYVPYFLVKMALWMQFMYRKPIYRKVLES
ncbi:MAG: hypothetical protein NZM38_05150 [Cytophagales bacterium]|nr:hypothetical protein [Cytophagales bacterium]MDW8384140.1 hypothetical protein [Flammeovirgaceae bacterium]